LRFRVQGQELKVLGLRFWDLGAELWISCGPHSTKHTLPSNECFSRTSSLRKILGVWGLGFGVWGLRFGVWGLRFGV
jgi:hypothetical protein